MVAEERELRNRPDVEDDRDHRHNRDCEKDKQPHRFPQVAQCCCDSEQHASYQLSKDSRDMRRLGGQGTDDSDLRLARGTPKPWNKHRIRDVLEVQHNVQREDDRTTNICGEAASGCCGSVAIDKLCFLKVSPPCIRMHRL